LAHAEWSTQGLLFAVKKNLHGQAATGFSETTAILLPTPDRRTPGGESPGA
jgi:hypothetical protein